MNNSNVNKAERRLQEVEDRLEGFEAPQPPEGLLESIQAEIPTELGTSGGSGSSALGRRTWFRLAASLAVVAVGGTLGYRLLQDGPQPGDVTPTVDPSTPVVELGEQLPTPPPGPALEAAQEQASTSTPGRVPDRDASASSVAKQAGDPAPTAPAEGIVGRSAKEIGEKDDAAWRKLALAKPKAQDRRDVGGNESGQQSQLLDGVGRLDSSHCHQSST